jgi:hypothetical protein
MLATTPVEARLQSPGKPPLNITSQRHYSSHVRTRGYIGNTLRPTWTGEWAGWDRRAHTTVHKYIVTGQVPILCWRTMASMRDGDRLQCHRL